MKKVLIALDYGISAREIAEKGYELAQGLNAKVTLLHVVAEESYYNTIDSAPFMLIYGSSFFNVAGTVDMTVASLDFLGKLKSHLNDPEIEIEAIRGDFADVILATAREKHFDMIVVGSNSKNWIQRTIEGSVTESVLKESEIPLFIIPIKENE